MKLNLEVVKMRRYKTMLNFWMSSLVFTLALPIMASAGQYEDFRYPRESSTTKNGYPTPLSGKPLTKTPVIAKMQGVTLKEYPKHYDPAKESLADNEMRITVLGSGGPAPVRRAQAASGYLVELANGDNFIFDIGPGTSGNLYSMGVHPAFLDKVFINHLHLDHCGGIFPLFDAMGWARNTPLQVWGPSGSTSKLGIKAFTKIFFRVLKR